MRTVLKKMDCKRLNQSFYYIYCPIARLMISFFPAFLNVRPNIRNKNTMKRVQAFLILLLIVAAGMSFVPVKSAFSPRSSAPDSAVFTDPSPRYQAVDPAFSIQRIEYAGATTILHILIKPSEGQISLFGSTTSDSWHLQSGKEIFPLIALRQVARDGKIEEDRLGRGESVFLEFSPGAVITCKAVFPLVSDNIASVNMTQGYNRTDRVIFRNIALNTQYGKKPKQPASNPTDEQLAETENHSADNPSSDENGLHTLKTAYEDSLKTAKDKSVVGRLWGSIAQLDLLSGDYDMALDNYKNSLKAFRESGNSKGMAGALSGLGGVSFYKNDRAAALGYYEEALDIQQKLNDKQGASTTLTNMGTIYDSWFRFDQAVHYYDQALNLKKQINDKGGVAKLQYRIGNVYFESGNYDKSLDFYQQNLATEKELGNKSELAASFNNIGVLYYEKTDYEHALENYELSLQNSEAAGDKGDMGGTLNNIGNIKYDQKFFEEALEYYNRSLKAKENTGNKQGMAISLFNIGNTYQAMEDYQNAISSYQKSNQLARETGYRALISETYTEIAKLQSLVSNCKEAYESLKSVADMQRGAKSSRQLSEMLPKYMERGIKTEKMLASELANVRRQFSEQGVELNKALEEVENQKLISRLIEKRNQDEIAILAKDNQIKQAAIRKQRTLLGFLATVLMLILIFTFMIFRQYSQKKKAYVMLEHKNDEIGRQNIVLTSQKLEIERQQKDIRDSITYASRIQKAVLPPVEILEKALPDHFILYKPRDIVSGDFFWFRRFESKLVIVAADCTGHGVPGAFMSMLGVAFLNEIMNQLPKIETDGILNSLRDNVMSALHQTGREGEAQDGMDMALCIIDLSTRKLQFSGAYNPLYVISGEELVQVKADKMPIGISLKPPRPFTSQEVELKSGDILYMFSDGYADQLGGPHETKFLLSRFRDLILSIRKEPMSKQKVALDQSFENWRGTNEQIDDILVLGIRMP